MKSNALKKLILFLLAAILCLALTGIMTACQNEINNPDDTTESGDPDTKAPDTNTPDGTVEETQGETQPPTPETILFKAGEGIILYDAYATEWEKAAAEELTALLGTKSTREEEYLVDYDEPDHAYRIEIGYTQAGRAYGDTLATVGDLGYVLKVNGTTVFMLANAEAGIRAALDTFKELCDMFTQYKFPLTYDFANRFRTGEMPLGIADYTLYTQLNAFATEIRGLWEMTTLPGYEQEDGSINNTSTTTVSGLVMMADAKAPENAWKYIDWITSEEAQSRYGNEYTALLGNGTIHATANKSAMMNMNWNSEELETLMAQFNNLTATPEYPGSYIITRYVDFAFLAAYNDNADPVESMLSQYIFINKEISRKRAEFDLDTLELGETLADREAAAEGADTEAAE